MERQILFLFESEYPELSVAKEHYIAVSETRYDVWRDDEYMPPSHMN
jgi:hypothetical protein